MGYMSHHSILITSWNQAHLEALHQRAAQIINEESRQVEGIDAHLGYMLTPITDDGINGYRSFCLLPDGSKEGWTESDAGDRIRSRLKEALRQDDNLRWVEVQYGDDDWDTKIIDDSDAHRRRGEDEEQNEGRPDLHRLKCPVENGGCGLEDGWKVAIDREARRIVLDCAACEYRISLPLERERLSDLFSGPLDESGTRATR